MTFLNNLHTTNSFQAENAVPLYNAVKSVSSSKKGWWCNLSESIKLTTQYPYLLKVKRRNLSQYATICALLKQGTCDKIFFDCDLDNQQAEFLGKLQKQSGTQLIHAKLAMQFNRAIA
ncbi:hypothetical protein [Glaciecola sp. 1036]|uniref:hypothetical protein n=1 Tax=Alteromonadaceae TaxID=72275 RepID=UPI003D083DBD